MEQNARTEQYEEITVFGKPALFTGCRLDRGTVPEGLYAYDVRHDDDHQGIPREIAKHILVNHWGTILLAEPLKIPKSGFLLLNENTDWSYVPIDDNPVPLAAIEYLSSNGKVRETEPFFDEASFRKTVKEELCYGVPLCMVIYEFGADQTKSHIPMNWVEDLDTLPCGMRYEPSQDERRRPCDTAQEFLQKYGTDTVRTDIAQETRQSDRYEIYQMKSNADGRYLFCSYANAQAEIKASDYRCVYAATMPKGAGLEDLYVLHNRDDRPAGKTMRSLSVSDIVVLHTGKQAAAHYVDNIGFVEIPDFAEKLKKIQERQNRSPKVHGER